MTKKKTKPKISKEDLIITGIAIFAVMVIEVFAILNGMNGVMLSTSIGLISTLAGHSVLSVVGRR